MPATPTLPPQALAMALGAAALHALWNLLLKGARERLAFSWWAVLVSFVVYSPILFAGAAPSARAWPYALASGLGEVAYFAALARAYRDGDFSLVYPVARGLNPALLALWALLFLGEVPSALGTLGLVLVLGGLALVGGARRWLQGHPPAWTDLRNAAAVSVCSSACSAVDAAAVRFTPAPAYTVLVLGITALATAPLFLALLGPARLAAAGRAAPGRILLVGVVMMLAYGLTVQAFSIARAGYIGAIREVSVVLAALAGWLWFGEGFGAERVAGSILIFAGLVAIALGG